MDSWLCIYFILQVIVQYHRYLFALFVHWKQFHLAPMSFSYVCIFYCFSIFCLTSWDAPGLSCIYSVLALELFQGDLFPFIGEQYLKFKMQTLNMVIDTGCHHFWPYQWIALENICILTHTYTYHKFRLSIYLCV